ncbi:MAG: response regulator [Desulforhopalus sp.]
MVEIASPQSGISSLSPAELLSPGEVVAVIDDSPDIIIILSHYLTSQGIAVVRGSNSRDLKELLTTQDVALVLLDIGLPDQDGNEILSEIVPAFPDLGIIMVTGSTDIQVALECIRRGADDYLTKPVSLKQFTHTIENTLKKRRLSINNRIYQQHLQQANKRMRFLHHLNLKMNTAYLNTVELRGILQAILIGITSDEGLRFNRAFLALYNEESRFLEGQIAIGPVKSAAAELSLKIHPGEDLELEDILENIRKENVYQEGELSRLIQSLRIAPEENDHVLIYASNIKRTVQVENGHAPGCRVPESLIDILGESSFVVVPLYSPRRGFGVIIVDNSVSKVPINSSDIYDLETFASQASLAIEHSHLYAAMAEKIEALELVTEELEKSKDLLIEAERASTIGRMSAQLLHSIRNPLTSIGGTSRLLARKTQDPYVSNFLHIITEEASKIEVILENLLCFVESGDLHLAFHPLYALIRKTVMIFYTTMKEKNIEYRLDLDGPEPELAFDEQQIRLVFIHLIRNSIEAMDQGGLLQVSAEEDTDGVIISLTDSGPGIPEDVMNHVKDPYFTTKTQNVGMGLALVEKIVADHRGQFALHGGESRGTTASVRLVKGLLAP